MQSAEIVVVRGTNPNSQAASVDPVTGRPSGTAADQQLLITLKEQGYEGGATVAHIPVDLMTGFPAGSPADLSARTMLKQSSYEGGGTIVDGR